MPASNRASVRQNIVRFFSSTRILALLPALCLGAFALWGQQGLFLAAIGLPALLALFPIFESETTNTRDSVSGLSSVLDLERALDLSFVGNDPRQDQTGALACSIDEFSAVVERYGQKPSEYLMTAITDRIRGALRDPDVVAFLGDAQFGIVLQHVRRLDIEACIQIANRIQNAISEPFSHDGQTINLTASVGFCMASRLENPAGLDVLNAAKAAMIEAGRNGPAAIRSYSDDMAQREVTQSALAKEVSDALENGQIIAYFQPQVASISGKTCGFEALARWNHPLHGVVLPGDFLPLIESAGLSERLGEVILFQALSALKSWDNQGFDIQSIGVNFSTAELSNPKLVEKISWELDRFDFAPERLSIEILETVFSKGTDAVVTRNISALAKMGCKIDLDDFGTGHASIAHIQKLSVSRIKIDRSFVARLDEDDSQKRIVTAILTMANQLDIEAIAEGVETPEEYSTLAQLKCGQMQGFGIARPMPIDDTANWIAQRQSDQQLAS
jgi:diguanylate cyclase (GGDEF)-like protein